MIIAGGLWATVSLLVRHWRSIEAHASRLVSAARAWPASAVPLDQQLRAYVQRLSVEACLCLGNSPMLLLLPLSPIPSGDLPSTPSGGGSGGGQLQLLAATVWKQRSLPPLAAYNSLEPYQTFLSSAQLPAARSMRAVHARLVAVGHVSMQLLPPAACVPLRRPAELLSRLLRLLCSGL